MWYIRYFILLALAISVTGRGVIDDVLDEEWKLFKVITNNILKCSAGFVLLHKFNERKYISVFFFWFPISVKIF